MIYYEGRGQNWERAAFIKARAGRRRHRGGRGASRASCAPFVFRKYLDYAAIADVHSIKRQIHAHKGHGEIAVKGHNVKLGRGGIREIEFFVQTQQLIAGGRMPELRCRATEAMLAELDQRQWIDEETRDELTEAYWFLREVEHRIQMVRDEQTHLLPETDADMKRIAFMLGLRRYGEVFRRGWSTVLETVERRYAALFETGGQAFHRDRQPRLHRPRRRSGHAGDAEKLGFQRALATFPASSAPGITAATAPPTRSRRASG